jgi:hybrid cluster-associated redox disulfide protein
MNKITKDTILSEILELKGAEKILGKYNLPCLSCPMAKFEVEKLKIGEVCETYGINLEELLKDLNGALGKA